MKLSLLLSCFLLFACQQQKPFDEQIKHKLMVNAAEYASKLTIDSFIMAAPVSLDARQLDSAVHKLAVETSHNMMMSYKSLIKVRIKEDSVFAIPYKDTALIYQKLAEEFKTKQMYKTGGYAVSVSLSLTYDGYKFDKQKSYLFDGHKKLIEIESFVR